MNNKAEQNGGAIYIEGEEYFSSSNCMFRGNIAHINGGSIYMTTSSSSYTITKYIDSDNCTFSDNQALQNGGAIFMMRSSYTNSNNCIFVNNSAGKNGGALYLYSGPQSFYMTLTQSNYTNSRDCKFEDNRAGLQGGAIYLQSSNLSYLIGFNFTRNQALQSGGAISLNEIAYFTYSSKFILEKNSAAQVGGAIYLQDYSSFQNSEEFSFVNNSALQFGGAIFLQQQSNLSLLASITIDKNQAGDGGGGICMQDKSGFYNTFDIVLQNNNANYGGGLYIGNKSQLINNTNLRVVYNRASQCGCGLAILSQTSVKHRTLNISVFNNTSQVNGGGLCIISNKFGDIEISNITFECNTATQNGGAIVVQSSDGGHITLQNIKAYNNKASKQGGGLYSDLSANLNLTETEFINNSALNQSGGGISLAQFYQLYSIEAKIIIDSSNFTNNTSPLQGGGLYLKSNIVPSNITVIGCNFTQNIGTYGGALYLELARYFSLENNTFTNNQAVNFSGGALYSTIYGSYVQYGSLSSIATRQQQLQSSNLTGLYEKINPFFIKNNTFVDNIANQTGGAIMLDFVKAHPSVVGLFYDILANITDPSYYSIISMNQSLIRNNFIANNAQQGGNSIRINGLNTSYINDINVDGSCIRIQKLLFDNNTFIDNISPQGNFYSTFNSTHQTYYPYNSSIIMCQCIYGEQLLLNPTNQARYCDFCQPGTYINRNSYNKNNNTQQPERCQQCPNGFQCSGGYDDLNLVAGYWSNKSPQIKGNLQSFTSFECNISVGSLDICLGSEYCTEIQPDNCTPDSICYKGYTGPGCVACNEDEEYFNSGHQRCSKCARGPITALLLLGVMAFTVVLLCVSLQSTKDKLRKNSILRVMKRNSAHPSLRSQEKDNLSPLLRILTNYFQNISLIVILHIEVPNLMLNFLSVFTSLGQSGGQPIQMMSYSYECLLSLRGSDHFSKKHLLLLTQFLSTVIFILAAIAVMCLIYLIIKKILKQCFRLHLYIIPAAIYLFLDFQPVLIYNSLQFFACRKIAGEQYLIANVTVTCSDQPYHRQSLQVALPILLFQLAVPVLLLSLLIFYKLKSKLNVPVQISTVKYQLGYLYLGYKKNCFYWVFLRIGQRILIICIFLLFFDFNSQKAALTAIVLVGYTQLAVAVKPNKSKYVNKTEFISNLVQITSFLAAIVLEDMTYNFFQNFFLAAALLLNIVFILYMVAQMAPKTWLKFVLFLLNWNCLKQLQCSQRCLAKHKKLQRNWLSNWRTLSHKFAYQEYLIQKQFGDNDVHSSQLQWRTQNLSNKVSEKNLSYVEISEGVALEKEFTTSAETDQQLSALRAINGARCDCSQPSELLQKEREQDHRLPLLRGQADQSLGQKY